MPDFGQRMRLVERFIAEAGDLDGVVLDRLDRYLDRWAGPAGARATKPPANS